VSVRQTRGDGQVARTWRRFRKDRFAMLALSYLVLLVLAGTFWRTVAPYNPAKQLVAKPFSGPSWSHWVGTDDLGRDVFSRLIQAGGVSIRFSLIVVTGALLLAVPIGLLSGYVGGRLDNFIMRVMDGILSFPGLVLAIALVSVLGPNIRNAMIAIGIGTVPGFTRLVRGQALAVKEESFIEASRAIGTPRRQILLRHVFPNVLSPLVVSASIVFGVALLVEAGLSFLGLGAQPPTASWGSMLQRAYTSVLSHPWHIIPPGVAISLTVLAFNTVGDGLRAALNPAPRVRRRGRMGLTTVERETAPTSAPSGLLVVSGLSLEFVNGTQVTRVVDDVSFSIRPGETLGLVGESGCGKTVTSLSIMRLLPSPPARIVGGTVHFDGVDLLSLPFGDMATLRGDRLAMVFQDPMASLNPALTVVHQVGQVARWHEGISAEQARARALETLELVGVSQQRANAYPHEFSGGMRQRAMIAMALVCRPKLLIADEPTTALDVTIQAQVLELLHELRDTFGMAMLFVTHDLGVVADICDRVAVMYAGQIVETAPVSELFRHPQHPYTEGLLRAVPQGGRPRTPLYVIPGQVPQFGDLPVGCRFADRCPYVTAACRDVAVSLRHAGEGRLARCVRTEQLQLGRR
jgi:peptide/nickel transport system permease protein